MARDLMGLVIILLVALGAVRSAPVQSNTPPEQQQIDLTEEQKAELIKQLESDILRAYALRAVAEGVKLENEAEERLVDAAVDALEENPGPERRLHLQQVQELLKRDRRAVEALSGILSGSASLGAAPPPPPPPAPASPPPPPPAPVAGVGASASAGSDSGSILNLVGPLIGSSSAGGGGGTGGAAGGSDSGSILNLVGPLLGSSSGGGGASTPNANGGSDSGAILNLVGPLLGSSSAGGTGGAGGGAGLGTILSLLSSSKGPGGAAFLNSLAGLNIKGQIKGAKIALVGDKIQLLLRLKFGLLTKMINTISGVLLAKFPPDPIGFDNLRYPD